MIGACISSYRSRRHVRSARAKFCSKPDPGLVDPPKHLFRAKKALPSTTLPLEVGEIRSFLEEVAVSLKVGALDDWYRVSSRDFSQLHDHKGILHLFQALIFDFLTVLVPQRDRS